MNNIKKMVCSFFMVIGLLQNPMQASDACDELGRNALMNYVIEREVEIAKKQESLALLAQKRWDAAVDLIGKTQRNIDDYQKNSNSYVDILVQKAAIRCYVIETCKQIQEMFEDGADFIAKDIEGKTVIDFCKTRKIYCTLRKFGADFHLNKWASVYQNHLIASGVLTAAGAACFYAMHDSDKIVAVYNGLSWMDSFKFAMAWAMIASVSEILEEAVLEEDVE